MSMQQTTRPWIFYNAETATYDTRDGTKVGAELAENMHCLLDVWYVSKLREEQRAARRAAIASHSGKGV